MINKIIEWISVDNSTRIIAEAYDPDTETIYVRFLNGVEWYYKDCPPHVWKEFTSQSRGQYINRVLTSKPHGRYEKNKICKTKNSALHGSL